MNAKKETIETPSRLTISIIGAVMTVIVAVAIMGVQYQSVLDKEIANGKSIATLAGDVDDDIDRIDRRHEDDVRLMTGDHDIDIARLDESNKNRRDTIADLTARVAVLEEQIRLLLQEQGE